MPIRPGGVYCPIHESEVNECSTECFGPRVEFTRVAHRFRVYWYHRSRGIRPMPLALYKLRGLAEPAFGAKVA